MNLGRGNVRVRVHVLVRARGSVMERRDRRVDRSGDSGSDVGFLMMLMARLMLLRINPVAYDDCCDDRGCGGGGGCCDDCDDDDYGGGGAGY